MIMGDINGETEDFTTLQEMLKEEGWTDTATIASTWGGINKQPTCHASSKAKQTRRNYISVNRYLLPAIGGMRVQNSDA